MSEDVFGPDSLSTRGLPSNKRGYDRKAVSRLLDEAARNWRELKQRHDELVVEINRTGGLEFFKRDLAGLGTEISALMSAATEAADGIRQRVAAEAKDRRSAADGEAAEIVAAAEQQAFEARRDAWHAGVELLQQVDRTVAAMIDRGEADALIIRAEAEQESHRLMGAARKEGNDITRNARFEAERTVVEAKEAAEKLLEQAKRDMQSAQERTLALEGRRRELLDEMGRSRSETLAQPGPGIRVIQSQEGGSRRVEPVTRPAQVTSRPKPTSGEVAGHDPASYGDELAAEVKALRDERLGPEVEPVAPRLERPPLVRSEAPVERAPPPAQPDSESQPDPTFEPDRVGTPSAAAPREPAVEREAEAVSATGDVAIAVDEGPADVDDLFSSLRGESPKEPSTDAVAEPAQPAERSSIAAADPIDLRDRLLLPIQNRTLRDVKQVILDVQNEGLAALRTAGAWSAAADDLAGRFGGPIDQMARLAAEAGADAAVELVGIERPAVVLGARSSGLIGDMAASLASQLQENLSENGDSSTTLRRIFRAWAQR